MKAEDLLMVKVANQCRDLRLEQFKSKRGLAKDCNMDERTIARLEDDCTCSMPSLCRIITALGGDIEIKQKE